MRKALPNLRAQWVLGGKVGTWARAGTLAAAMGTAGGLLTTGCAVSENDVVRWEKTERGPYKLVAVIDHDKYSWPLRVEAAMALIKMPPRGGRRQGIAYLTDKFQDEEGVDRDGALIQLNDESRKKVVDGMVPELVKGMQTPPPQKKADGTIDFDDSIPYKDAAFALVSHDPPLVSDVAAKDQLVAALTQWVQTDFENRIDNSAQQYGAEQVMRFLGAPAVRTLPSLITESSSKVDKISQLVADLGDADAKAKGSDALVALAKRLSSDDWFKKNRQMIEDADKKAGSKVKPEQVDAQTKQYQDQLLTTVFGAMKRMGGRPVIEYCIAFAADPKNSDSRRATALAAVEGKVDKTNQSDIDRIYAIAKDDNTPDAVRDLAFSRLTELPKEVVVPKLYSLFDSKKWKVRWVAASNVLKTIGPKDLPDFMKHLPTSASTKMGMSEAMSYGSLIMQMKPDPKGPKPQDVLNGYLTDHALGPKLTALGGYYQGQKSDAAKVTPLETDPTPVPKCDPADDCGWTCDVPKPNSQETDSKTIATVGDFAKYCIAPSLGTIK